MKVVCAWCAREIGRAKNSSLPDTEISHGICEKCADNLSFQKGVSIQSYLDSMMLPVMMVGVYADQYLIAKIANKAACTLLGKEPRDVVQHLLGNVFECSHARLPEGCGRTIHCSGCTVRRAVMKTYSTGETQYRVPATLKRFNAGQASSISLYVTTMMAEDMVALRIDWFGTELPTAAPD